MSHRSLLVEKPATRVNVGHLGARAQPERVSRCRLDLESQEWWSRLHARDPVRSRAIAELHSRLRREAAFHVRRHVRNLSGFPRGDIEDLATQAADDALMVLLRKLEDYRGDSQFWTWARRFAQLEAPVCVRRRVGHDHVGISSEPEQALLVADAGCSPHDLAETRELLKNVSRIMDHLSTRQRTVLIALAIDGFPVERLARELHSTPGAIYKALHDARAKLRFNLARAA